MITYIIVSAISFLFNVWFCKVPKLRCYENYHSYDYKYKCIGIKRWSLGLLIIVSLIPILNLIVVLSFLVGLIFEIADGDFYKIFPSILKSKAFLKFKEFLSKDV